MSDGERDDACVALLEAGTSRGILARIRLDEREGVDAYACRPSLDERNPRDVLRVCAAEDCPAAFWVRPTTLDGARSYCSLRCRVRWFHRERNPRGYRTHRLTRAVA